MHQESAYGELDVCNVIRPGAEDVNKSVDSNWCDESGEQYESAKIAIAAEEKSARDCGQAPEQAPCLEVCEFGENLGNDWAKTMDVGPEHGKIGRQKVG